jgi:DNA polymerase-3 subunit delta
MKARSKSLDVPRLRQWLIDWSQCRHKARLDSQAADLLIELVGPEIGMLDQDLAKLALFVEPDDTITEEMVRDIVGGWRAKTVWELVDAAVDGDAAEALRQFDHLLQSGEHPLAVLGQISWSLRRFAAATRVYEEMEQKGRADIQQALVEAGFPKWPNALDKAQRQLKQLSRQRAGKLNEWLLEADLRLKGSHSSPQRARLVLELLFLRLSRQLDTRRPKSARKR